MAQSGVDDLHEDSSACGGPRLFRNVFEKLLDGLFCQSHFIRDFPVGPAFQEMLDDRGFSWGQLKPLLRLEDDLVLPLGDPGLVHHDEDAVSHLGLIHQGRAAQEDGAVGCVHQASKLNLLPVLLLGPDCEELPDVIDETRDGWREYPVCRFPILALNDVLTQFPCPSILIE